MTESQFIHFVLGEIGGALIVYLGVWLYYTLKK